MKNKQMQIFGAWCGPLYIVLEIIGFWLFPNFIMPLSPSLSPDEVADIIQGNVLGIRIGMVISMFGALIIMPFCCAIAIELKEIEGGVGMLTLWQVMGGVCTTILAFYPSMWWLLASFRPDTQSHEILQLLNDAGWLQFVGGVTIFLPCFITVALGSFMDKRENPPFPRWFGYFSVWAAIIYLPTQLLFFFHDGPFAYNGLLSFWVPSLTLLSWWIVMGWMLRKSARSMPD